MCGSRDRVGRTVCESAQGQDVRETYDRAESLNRRTQGLVVGEIQAMSFVPDSAKLWY